MNKEQIDDFIIKLEQEDFEGLSEYISNEELKQKFLSGEDIDDNLFFDIVNGVYDALNGELLDYFETKMIAIGEEEFITNDERKEKAKERFKKNIKELTDGKSDDEKLEELQGDLTELEKFEIAKTIISDEKKAEALRNLKDEYYKVEIIKTINDDLLKYNAVEEGFSDYSKVEIVKTMSNSKDCDILKLKMLETVEFINDKALIVKTLSKDKSNDKIKFELMENWGEGFKSEIAETLSDGEQKIEFIKKIQERTCKSNVIKSIEDEQCLNKMLEMEEFREYRIDIISRMRDETKVRLLDELEDLTDLEKAGILGSLKQEKIEELFLTKNISANVWQLYRMQYANIDFVKENIEIFMNLEGAKFEDLESKIQILDRMSTQNSDVIKGIDFGLLDEKYINSLGEEKINLISCYPDVQRKILSLSDSKLNIFGKCISSYLEERPNEDEWTVLAEEILEHIDEYNDLFENLADTKDLKNVLPQDIPALTQVLQGKNWCDIKNIEDVRNFQKIREEKCKKIIEDKEATIEQKREIVFQKIFGHDSDYANWIIGNYGEDIENIDEGEMKDYVRAIKALLDVKDEDTLKQIFENCSFVRIDKVSIERNLKTEYGKKFNEGLYKPKKEDRVENVFEAGADFKMIITAVGAYSNTNPENYKEDWNRPAIGSQHFCASYIRNDMIATAPIRNICYGFSQMKDDALMLSGPSDIYSSAQAFVSNTRRQQKYLTPDEQINQTGEYNEMDFRRIQGGEKKQPDYIIVFRKNGKIGNMEEAERASEQWGGMPIVVVDVDKCLESEKAKVSQMLMEYSQNPNRDLAKSVNQKVNNNRKTDINFCSDLESSLSLIRQELEKEDEQKELKNSPKEEETKENKIIGIGDLQLMNEEVSAEERKEAAQKIKQVYQKIREATTKEEENNVR